MLITICATPQQAFYAAVQQAGGDIEGGEAAEGAAGQEASYAGILPDVQVGQGFESAASGFAAEQTQGYAEPPPVDSTASYAEQLSAYEELAPQDTGAALTQTVPYAGSVIAESMY